MKSSTLIRSMLSKENMDVIENLAQGVDKETAEAAQDNAPEEYYRPEDVSEKSDSSIENKAKEIDMLWQNFKTAQFSNKSPAVYVTMGFIGGIITTVLVFGVFGYFASKPDVKFSLPSVSSVFSKFSSDSGKTEQTIEDKIENSDSAKVVVPDEQGNVQSAQAVSSEVSDGTLVSSDIAGAKKHIVAEGETVEGIIKHYYGAYTPERAERIKQVNNLQTLDRIGIGQELIIPRVNE